MKLLLNLLLIFFISNLNMFSQNNMSFDVRTCKIKKHKYLPLIVKIVNTNDDSVVLRFEPLVRLSLDTMYSYLFPWNSLIDNLNNEINPKIEYRKKRVKPRPVHKWKDFKLKSNCGKFFIEKGVPIELLVIKPGDTIEKKMILFFNKNLYRALKRGLEYQGKLVYDSGYMRVMPNYPRSIVTKDDRITEGIKFQGEFTFKRRFF